MHFGRRWFLGLSLASGIALHVRGVLAAVLAPGAAPGPPRALAPFLDTLIPADETPPATALGVDREILAKGAARVGYMRLLRAGCTWLDGEARKSGAAEFASLPPAHRDAIVARAAAAPSGSLPRVFFLNLRQDAFFSYYARAESWRGVGYDGPPQPRGFEDFARPPA